MHTIRQSASFLGVLFATAAGALGQGLTDPIPGPIPVSPLSLDVQVVASGLTSPNTLVEPDDGTGRLFVTDQVGQVRVIDSGSLLPEPYLDIGPSGQDMLVDLNTGYDERGLLGMAFHPNFANPGQPGYGKFYTYSSEPVSGTADFTVSMPAGVSFNHQSVVREWTVDDPSANVFQGTSRELLRIDEPQSNHNGGALQFDTNNLLYISLGDGGAGNDRGNGHSPEGNGQDKSNVLGSFLRIDPLGTNGANGQYGIPDSNPFVGQQGVPEEIFVYGVRNPFRFSFDRETGDMLIGDVGQAAIEEVNRLDPDADAGVNLGWHVKEGTFLFDPDQGEVTEDSPGSPDTLNGDRVVDPVFQYDHDEGQAVIGGYVYRGDELPELAGQYIFGDLSNGPSGRVFVGDLDSGDFSELFFGDADEPLGLFLFGFGEDQSGEIYLLGSENVGPSGTTGMVLKLVPEPAAGFLAALGLLALAACRRRR